MIITIGLHQNIYEQLASEAESKGLTVEEIIKVVLGDHVSYMNPRPIPVSSLSFPIQNNMDKMSRMSKLLADTMVAQGLFKCPNCTMPLNSEALESGICNNCETKL